MEPTDHGTNDKGMETPQILKNGINFIPLTHPFYPWPTKF